MTATGPAERHSARFTPSTAVLLVLALLGALVLRNIFVAAHRVIGWGVATVVVATLLDPPITWLSRFVPKVLALLLAGLGIAAVAGALVYGVFDDLETETSALRDRGPAAAARLEERDDRIGDVARDLRLTERAEDAFEALEERFGAGTQVLATAAGTVPSYFVSFILTIFFILYGNRMFRGAVDQVDDPRRRRRFEHVVRTGVRRGRSYLWWALLQGSVVGVAAFLVGDQLDLPAPTVLGLVAAVAASVPYIGIVIGVVPTVLMTAGLRSPEAGAAIVAVALAAQVVEALVVRRLVDRRTLHVGPAIPVIVGSVGLEVYGIGGALYGVALAVFLLATADAAATEADEPLPTPNQDWAADLGPPVDPAPGGGGVGDDAPPGEGGDATVEQVPADVVVAPAPATSPPPGVGRSASPPAGTR